MASKRALKKSIKSRTTMLMSFYLFVNQYDDNTKPLPNKLEVLDKILEIEEEFIKRVNHPEPSNVKFYFKKLINDFGTQIEKEVLPLMKLE